jgi:hypothetical protein
MKQELVDVAPEKAIQFTPEFYRQYREAVDAEKEGGSATGSTSASTPPATASSVKIS